MKKTFTYLRTLLLTTCLLMGVNAWAYTPTLTESTEIAGYKSKAFFNIANDNVDDMCPASGDLRFRGSGYGLFNFGSGNRGADVTLSISATDLLLLEFKDAQNKNVTVNSVSNCTKNNTLSSGDILAFDVNADATSVNINVGRAGCIIAILVMEKDPDAATADYTLNYECNSIVVKTESGNLAVGSSVTTVASFFANDMKYFREDGEPTSFGIESSGNVFTVNVREAATYNYTVVSNAGATLNSGSGFEGESPRVGYPRYQKDGAALYMAAVDKNEYRTTVNLTEDNVSKTVNYVLQDGKEVAYYIEGEDITGMTLATNGNIPVRASNAKAAKSNEDVEITTLPAGKYKLHVGIFTSKTGYGDNTVNFGIGAEVFNAAFANVNLCEVESEEYTINATTSIKYLGSTSWGGAEFDYIWIEKTGDAEEISSVEATVGEKGWATYIAPYALDFSNVTGLTAYTATVSENTVTLTKVSNVPAGTGVVLKGATNTYNIPIIDSSETAKGDLKGSISKDTTADGTQYILTKDGGNAQFAPAIASTTIAAGKAYLVVAGGGESRLNVVIAGETTGIKAIEAQEAQEGIYNLQGQRVAKAQKGLYIVNGKKAIVK